MTIAADGAAVGLGTVSAEDSGTGTKLMMSSHLARGSAYVM
jgi:hypothetical protein